MNEGEHNHVHKDTAWAKVTRTWSAGWVWIIPAAALAIVGYLAADYAMSRGPTITISFQTAEGLTAQKTQVRYKAVNLGIVEKVRLSDDSSHVVATVEMRDEAEPLLTDEAEFWVVRPRLGPGLDSLGKGLQTLVSGSYIAIDPGHARGEATHEFEGLEKPPGVRSDQPGTVYFLRTDSLGNLNQGSPIYLHDVGVGEVLSYELQPQEREVRLRVFIRSPFDTHVNDSTYFWQLPGLSPETDSGGMSLDLPSPKALLLGGISFETPRSNEAASESAQSPVDHEFALHASRSAAHLATRPGIPYVTYVRGSVRGLGRGAEVTLFGKPVGTVSQVSLANRGSDAEPGPVAVRIAFSVFPQSMSEGNLPLTGQELQHHAERGLEVAVRTLSPLTQQKALELEWSEAARDQPLKREGAAWVLPGRVQDLGQLTADLSDIASGVSSIPFRAIGQNLNKTLVAVEATASSPELASAISNLDSTLAQTELLVREVRAGIGPALEKLPHMAEQLDLAVKQARETLGEQGYGANSTVHRNLERMTNQVAEAARSIRQLADYLNRHPEAALQGRDEDE